MNGSFSARLISTEKPAPVCPCHDAGLGRGTPLIANRIDILLL